MLRFLFNASLLAALAMPDTAKAQADASVGTRCRDAIRAVDERADLDMRDLNERIERLRQDVLKAQSDGSTSDASLTEALTAARLRRTEIYDEQHRALNEIRGRCDKMRAAESASRRYE